MDIVKEIGMPAMLGQLAEECCELGKAALKLQRIMMGKNPTPVTADQARRDLLEEATDVQDCLNLLQDEGYEIFDEGQHAAKMKRWAERIQLYSESRSDLEPEIYQMSPKQIHEVLEEANGGGKKEC